MVFTRTPRYVSIDIETTGLDPDKHQILEFAAVAWSDDRPVAELPEFSSIVRPEGDIVGCPYALDMNRLLISALKDPKVGKTLRVVMREFRTWLKTFGVSSDNKIHIIGQNFASFDLNFLNKSILWPTELISHRILDVSTIAATVEGMGSASCLGKPDLPGLPHQALYDARLAMYHAQQYLLKKESDIESNTMP